MSITLNSAKTSNNKPYATGEGDNERVRFTLSIPESYTNKNSGSSGSGSGSGSGGTTSDYDVYSSDIVVENVIVRDKEGNQINGTITKDSPPFTVDVVYTDFGENMERIDREDFRESTIQAMITNAGNFIPNATTRGAVSVLSTSNDFPRFQVRFTDISFEGGANGFAFRVIYQMEDQTFSGTATAAVYQAKPEEEDEDDELAPPTPYIIISQYSYGSAQIEAGQDLALEITYQNTSTDIALENIVMTVTPDPANMAIASASNTFYIDSLPAGASRSATIELQAKPAAEVGSHEVGITFNYEYISSKERKAGEKNEKIAIPITQIDRFDVDPVTELTEYLSVGDEGYVTISFINRGKSTTYNISGVASGNLEMITPSQHFGNLEAGKSDSIDVTFVPQEAGELYGEVTVQYEDENTNQKTIRVPFTVFVEEPYVPPAFDPDNMPGMEVEETGTLSPFTVIFCVVGGLMIAFPLAMYLMKRVKVKGIEDFDEDF